MIGILPAAGKAERIHGLPKYLLPIPGDTYLLDIHARRMLDAGCRFVAIGANPTNQHLPMSYQPRDSLVYTARNYGTMSQTVLSAHNEMIAEENVLFGMPDTYWTESPTDLHVYEKLHDAINDGWIAAAALFYAPFKHAYLGMCDFDPLTQRVTLVMDKPAQASVAWAWGALAWRPEFWKYIQPQDAHVGFALQRAIDSGEGIRAVYAKGCNYYDCGTPERYFECIRSFKVATDGA